MYIYFIYFHYYAYTTTSLLSLSSPPSPSLSLSLSPPLSLPLLSLSRGYIYHTVNIDTGWLVQCNGLLLYRKKSFDEGNSTNYCVRLNEKLEVNKICNLIFHTSCLILHTTIPHCLMLCICTCTLILQTFKHSILHSRRQRPCPVIFLS